MKYFQIQNKEELNQLIDHTAQYKNLNFSFTDKYINSLKKDLDGKNAFQLIVKENQEFTGYISSVEKNFKPNFLWITELFVSPNHQGKGIATTLIKKVLEEAKKKNLNGLITQTEFENIPAQNLYTKVGFLEVENPDWKNGKTYELKF